jgi:hypothetical protein
MYPFVIIWSNQELVEIHEDETYGYVDDLAELYNIQCKWIDYYTDTYTKRLKWLIKDMQNITIESLFEMVNGQPYETHPFFSIKYFDISMKSWKNYEMNEKEINEYFLCLLKNRVL